jgi:hypothetical protein
MLNEQKYDYSTHTENLLCKTFGATRIVYSTSDDRIEESHYKLVGTATSDLGHWSTCVLGSGADLMGCSRWSYLFLGKDDKKFAIVTVYRVGNTHNSVNVMAFQQQYRTQYTTQTAREDIHPHKQTMIDLKYCSEDLKSDGFEVIVFIDVNQPLDHILHVQSHHHKYTLERFSH